MAGILDSDAWRRSNGGLWLPRAFAMSETVYGWCCCESSVIAVSCCSVTTAPAYFSITLAGIPEGAQYSDGTYIFENYTRLAEGSNGCWYMYGTWGTTNNMSFALCMPDFPIYSPTPTMAMRAAANPSGPDAYWGGYISGPTGYDWSLWTSSNPRLIGGEIFWGTQTLDWSNATASIYPL